MRHYFLYLIVSIIVYPLVACESDDVYPPNNIINEKPVDLLTVMNNNSTNICTINNQYDIQDISLFMKLNLSSLQGAAKYGYYMFLFQKGLKNVYICDLRTKEHVSTMEFSSNSRYHCNNANFSTKFYSDTDLFPLIYVSQQNNNIHQVLVYRVIGDSIENLSLNLVQTITGPSPTDINHMFYQDCIVDFENDYLYIYAHHKRDQQDSFHIVRYKMPTLSDSNVKLTNSDIYSSIYYDNKFSSPQGAVCHKGLLYFVKGVPQWNEQVYLDVVDFDKKEVCSINLTKKGFKKEPEGLFLYEDNFICTTNNGGVYSLNLVEN